MVAEKYSNSEQELIDALYDLQALREISGADYEPAVFDHDVQPRCNVFIDKRTNDRIVMTGLPLDMDDFDGAAVWLSNPEVGVAIDSGKWQASPYDVIFWIDKACQNVRYFNPRKGSRIKFDAGVLAGMLSVPRIKPAAQSEIDPREIPDEIEFISTPQTNTYTLASRLSDSDIEFHRRIIARRYGIIDYDYDKSTTFDLQIHEVLPGEDSLRTGEFDREFAVLLHLGNTINMPVIPWGRPEINIKGNDFKIRVVREGMLISAIEDGKELVCVPTPITEGFIDSILDNAIQSNGYN